MEVYVYSTSAAFRAHLDGVQRATHRQQLLLGDTLTASLHIVHSNSFGRSAIAAFMRECLSSGGYVSITDDAPSTRMMAFFASHGAAGYCNSYMAVPHYQQMFRLVAEGQSWYPPRMLSELFRLTSSVLDMKAEKASKLDRLTKREREVARSVADGKSSKEVAIQYGIAERTVKAHLSRIYEKLKIKDRMELIICLNDEIKF